MYRYLQVKEKGSWRAFSCPGGLSSKEVASAVEAGARKVTVLSVSEVVDEYTTKDQLSYKGPLYFDIDCKEDLYLAIKSAKQLVSKLLDMEVGEDRILVYCSGSKGLHVLVDERVFSSGRATRLLPKIYKEMARSLFVFGVDYQVYSGGRGNSFRVPNLQREDGNYRVCVTLEELADLTPELYREYVSQPRRLLEFPPGPPDNPSPQLSTLFERSKQLILKAVKTKKAEHPPIPSGLISEIKHTTPQCINDLCDGKAEKGRNFNELALQLSIYLSVTDSSESTVASLASRLSTVTTSSVYTADRDRMEHIVGLAGYVKSCGTQYKFYCGAMRKLLSSNPCSGCPVEGKMKPTQESSDLGIDLGVIEKEDGYYIAGMEGDRRISTFTMEILDYHAEESPNSSVERRTGFKAKIKAKGINGSNSAELFLTEDMWTSRASLINQISGITNIVFLGTDNDVQKVKHLVMSKGIEDVGKVMAVYTAGMIRQQIGKSEVMVQVEPEGSMNSMRVKNTHHLNSEVSSPPALLGAKMPVKGDQKYSRVLEALMGINSQYNMGLILGWTVACHFKAHLTHTFNQFPILSVWGPAGVGKTQTVVQTCFLNGCAYVGENSPMDLPSATEWALVDFCSSTTTAPRILDEANESKLGNKMNHFAEMVKSAWGNLTVNRGTIKKGGGSMQGRTGARTVRIPISSPLITLSEQSYSFPAVQQRSVQVFLTRDSRGDKEEENFMAVTDHRDLLTSIGKGLMVKALTTPSSEVKAKVVEQLSKVPKAYNDRPRYSFAVVLAGLLMLQEFCESMGYEAARKVQDMYQATLRGIVSTVDEVVREKSRTEIDLILLEMALMATVTAAGMGKELIHGVHYSLQDNDDLVLDHTVAFPLYLQYAAKNRKDTAIRHMQQFVALIRQEPYFKEEVVLPGFAARKVMVLDGAKMREKGIDVSMFSYSSV